MRRLPFLTLLFAAGACVPQSPPPAPAPAPAPVAAAPPPPVATPSRDWRDWPLTPGDWTYRTEPDGSIARFGVAGGAPLLTLRCDAATRRVRLAVAGGDATSLTIRTTSLVRALPVQPGGDATAAAMLPANDGLLDALGFSRGRFVIERAGAPALVVPAWAEIERVTEDCRG